MLLCLSCKLIVSRTFTVDKPFRPFRSAPWNKTTNDEPPPAAHETSTQESRQVLCLLVVLARGCLCALRLAAGLLAGWLDGWMDGRWVGRSVGRSRSVCRSVRVVRVGRTEGRSVCKSKARASPDR